MKLKSFLSKKLHSHIITYVIAIIAFHTVSVSASAQQLFTCALIGPAEQPCIVDQEACPGAPAQGSPEQNYCAQFNSDPGACSSANGYCQTCDSPSVCFSGGSCPSGFNSSSGFCASPSDVCCIDENISPPDPTVCYKPTVDPFGGACTCSPYTPPAGATNCGSDYDDEQACLSVGCSIIQGDDFYTCEEDNGNFSCAVCSPNPDLPGPYGGCTYGSLSACTNSCGSVPRPDVQGDCPDKHIDSALGCIPVEQGPFTTAFFRFLIGIAGGLALIVMLIGSIIFLTGGNNPEQVKKGKEIFFGALAGLLFIIISTILLRTIAGDIIGLPDF